jgi:predicted permease
VENDYTGPPTRAVLGYGAWQRLFGGDPGIIGRTLIINGMSREVIGILDRSFTSPQGFSNREVEVWLAMDPLWELFNTPDRLVLTVFGRVRPELSISEAQDELNLKIEELAMEKPSIHYSQEDGPQFVELSGLQVAMVGDTRTTLLMLLGAVSMLLLIAAANVANLFLARGVDRTTEVGIRTAMGAGQRRIVSQLLTESTVMSLSGGLLGVLLAFIGVRAFEILNPGNIPLIERISVDWRVLLFAGGVSLFTGLLFGSVPALQAARLDISSLMRDGLRGGKDRDRAQLRNTLVTTEIALALILLTGAGLLFNSFLRLQSVDPGFEPAGLVGVELNINGPRYSEDVKKEFVRRIDERLESIPGIEGVATAITVPFQSWGGIRTGWLRWNWETPDREGLELFTMVHPATADYFSLLGADLRGRSFQPEDLTALPLPVVISQSFAERIIPDEDALGQIIYVHGVSELEDPLPLRIVGIVSGLHAWGLDQGSELTVYMPWELYGPSNSIASLLVKTSGESGSVIEGIREVIWAEDPDMPLPNIFSLEGRITESLTVPRFYSTLLVTFAVVALLLAAGGIYGSMLYSIGRRRQELSIRTALGADRARLIWLVLKRSGSITATGVIIGATGAWLSTNILESMVFGISTTDPVTFMAVAFFMTAVALAASLLPAWKAATADPMEALRKE